jgi:hypothetical protein
MVKRVMRKLIPFSGMADEDWQVFVIEDSSEGEPPLAIRFRDAPV